MDLTVATIGKEPLLRRFRVGRVLAVPIGYTKQLLHGGDGIDLATWALVMFLALTCPGPALASGGRGSFLVRLVLEALAAPLTWFSNSQTLALRVVVGSLLVGALKLYRLEIGRDQPQSLARWYAGVCCVQYAFLASLSWAHTEVCGFRVCVYVVCPVCRLPPSLHRVILTDPCAGWRAAGAQVLAGRTLHSYVLTFLPVVSSVHSDHQAGMTFIAVFSSLLLHVDVALLLLVLVVDCVVRQRLKLRWLLWCLVVFSAITWLLLSVPFDSYDINHWELWPAALRHEPRVFVWATTWDWLPIVYLALMGAVLQPAYRRHLLVALGVQTLLWIKGVVQHGPVLGPSLLAMPLLNLVAAAGAESSWFKRHRWYAGAFGVLLLCCALYSSYWVANRCVAQIHY